MIATKSLDTIKDNVYKYGIDALSNDELLAVILGQNCSEDIDPVITARKLILTFDGLDNVARLTVDDLKPYIGENAVNVTCAIELSKRFKKYRYMYSDKFDNPEVVFNYVSSQLMYLKQEVVKILVLNTKNMLVAETDMFKGGSDNSLVGRKEVLRYVLKKDASSFIIVHNHPSGQCNPSVEDINIAKKLIDSCNDIGISMLDFIIIGNGEYCTFKGRGII